MGSNFIRFLASSLFSFVALTSTAAASDSSCRVLCSHSSQQGAAQTGYPFFLAKPLMSERTRVGGAVLNLSALAISAAMVLKSLAETSLPKAKSNPSGPVILTLGCLLLVILVLFMLMMLSGCG
ncbi:hypothetical protein BKA58DRAFT_380275 [Alternaria rosae]|uniref:uncharacterized protein n=1 Tax=Alternaria rosae TaxID=1187941 RepID=UPI001E8E0637|nr:uncharacterized protein BKA58DRAFT_380275 [Alternaria rosae]KAH6875683.1 hypothetical protein BKA58DRAFT_380275 [Alternaria rosae]